MNETLEMFTDRMGVLTPTFGGVTYGKIDGTENHVEWWTTGCYATCHQWELLAEN